MAQEIRFCRIKKTIIRGKERYFLDVILKGQIPLKETSVTVSTAEDAENEDLARTPGDGEVGLDIGFRKLAVVTEDRAAVYDLLEKDRGLEKKKRKLLQYTERSRRSMNPYNYLPDGRIRPGSSGWIYSRHYRKVKLEYGEICRKQSVLQKQEQYRLAREISSYGNRFFVENLDFAKLGRIKPNGVYMSGTAPGEFLRILEYKLSQQEK